MPLDPEWVEGTPCCSSIGSDNLTSCSGPDTGITGGDGWDTCSGVDPTCGAGETGTCTLGPVLAFEPARSLVLSLELQKVVMDELLALE